MGVWNGRNVGKQVRNGFDAWEKNERRTERSWIRIREATEIEEKGGSVFIEG